MVEIHNICNVGVHYLFTDNAHNMDAYRFNKCEYNLLGIIQELSHLVGEGVDVKVEPLGVGSIWERLSLTTKDGKKIRLEWIAALLIACTTNPISRTFENIADWAWGYIKDGSYIHSLKNEKERLELEKEVRELREDSVRHANISVQNKIKRKVSNFYTEAQKDSRITSIGFVSSAGNPDANETKINRSSFDAYIIKDTMEDEEILTDVRIDIIAPVLRKRKIKWQGVYNSLPIPFKLCDTDFKKSVLKGDVEFTGGTYIICDLRITTAVDNEGETKISGYEVIAVHSCGKDDNPPIETESEKKRKQKQMIDNAPSLFDFEGEGN